MLNTCSFDSAFSRWQCVTEPIYLTPHQKVTANREIIKPLKNFLERNGPKVRGYKFVYCENPEDYIVKYREEYSSIAHSKNDLTQLHQLSLLSPRNLNYKFIEKSKLAVNKPKDSNFSPKPSQNSNQNAPSQDGFRTKVLMPNFQSSVPLKIGYEVDKEKPKIEKKFIIQVPKAAQSNNKLNNLSFNIKAGNKNYYSTDSGHVNFLKIKTLGPSMNIHSGLNNNVPNQPKNIQTHFETKVKGNSRPAVNRDEQKQIRQIRDAHDSMFHQSLVEKLKKIQPTYVLDELDRGEDDISFEFKYTILSE